MIKSLRMQFRMDIDLKFSAFANEVKQEINELRAKDSEIEAKLKVVEASQGRVDSEVNELQEKCTTLQVENEKLKKALRSDSIKITGIKMMEGEVLINDVSKMVHHFLGITLLSNEISNVFRVKLPPVLRGKGRHPHIILKVSSLATRSRILDEARKRGTDLKKTQVGFWPDMLNKRQLDPGANGSQRQGQNGF